ncbi:MAG: SIMPL domain-containing protein [Minisyncoccia bacterium]
MEKSFEIILGKTIKFLAIIVALGILSWAYLNYRQAQNIVNPERIITFSAEGKVFAKPDIAKITFSVITQGEKAEIVQSENDQKMAGLIDFIKKEGIKNEDIKTINYSLNPRYDYTWCLKDKSDNRQCPPKIVGYELNQTVEVKIRDFDKINEIIGGLTEKGANQISNISFEVDDIEDYKNLARIEALNKIEKRAKLISQKTSVKLGKIINISESGIYPPVYRVAKSLEASPLPPEETSSASLEPGLKEINVTLSVSYEIK